MYYAGMALSSFGNLHVLRWHGTELIGDLSCCIGVALSYSLEIFIVYLHSIELIREPSCVTSAEPYFNNFFLCIVLA